MYTALEDIKLEMIDFEWIKSTTKISHLKRAIKIIELDGDYYKELKQACYLRLQQLDPAEKRVVVSNYVLPESKHHLEAEITEWEKTMQGKEMHTPIAPTNLEDYESYFDNQKDKLSQSKRKEAAERERIKGNQAIKSKDYKEAIDYYTRSIDYDPSMHQSYGNRALVHLKLKQFEKCIEDCDAALRYDSKYCKAYHRKAKALSSLKRNVQAYRCYQQILKIDPEDSEMNKEMKELREQMTENERYQVDANVEAKQQFTKIAIEEDDEEDDQMERNG